MADDLFPDPGRQAVLLRDVFPLPQFLQLLSAVGQTWRERRDEVEQASDHIAGELRQMASGIPGGGPRSPGTVQPRGDGGAARRGYRPGRLRSRRRSSRRPPCWKLCYAATNAPPHRCPWARCGAPVRRWRGGIYDQLAGGFARYSVDADWGAAPRRCCTTNALLLRVYAHWARRTRDPLAQRVAAETAAFLLNDLYRGWHVHLIAGR